MGYMVHLNDQFMGPATPRAGQGQVVIMATTIDKDTPLGLCDLKQSVFSALAYLSPPGQIESS